MAEGARVRVGVQGVRRRGALQRVSVVWRLLRTGRIYTRWLLGPPRCTSSQLGDHEQSFQQLDASLREPLSAGTQIQHEDARPADRSIFMQPQLSFEGMIVRASFVAHRPVSVSSLNMSTAMGSGAGMDMDSI